MLKYYKVGYAIDTDFDNYIFTVKYQVIPYTYGTNDILTRDQLNKMFKD